MNAPIDTRFVAAEFVAIADAAVCLANGGLVAFPTETVYGLGADATRAEAVAGIYGAKDRPKFNPLIAHVANLDAARREGVFDASALRLAEAFWPGPLTLVVPASATCSVSDLARAGLGSVGLRVPAHPIAAALLRRVARPVAAPSANRSGRVSPTLAAHVLVDLDGRSDAVVDGGPARVGVESTILACLGNGVHVLRPGGIPRDAIEALIGPLATETAEDGKLLASGQPLISGQPLPPGQPLAPGMLASHYAPRARLRLNVEVVEPGEAVLLFGGHRPAGLERSGPRLDLSPDGSLVEAAASLFAALRSLDASGAATIAVSPIPTSGLGEAINDRLERAAAGR